MPLTTEPSGVLAAQWSAEYVASLPDDSFAFVDKDGNRHLPYKDKDGKADLPHVRNAISRLSQVKNMSDEERAAVHKKLQGCLKNVKASDDTVMRSVHTIFADDFGTAVDTALQERLTQDNKDEYGLPTRVHLLRAGDFHTAKYGLVPISASDLYEMKFNFERGLGMADEGQTGIPIDFGHKSGGKAAGWIHGLEVVATEDGGTELWGTNVEWSESGRKKLLGKDYKLLSSDFYPAAFGEWVDPESGVTAKNVIVGAALTNRPLMTGNKPVIASEVEADAALEAEATGVKTVIYVNASETIKENRMNFDQLRLKELADLTALEYKEIVAHQADLSDDERKKFGLEAAAPAKEEPKKEEPKVEATEGTVAIKADEFKALQETVAKFAADRETDKQTIATQGEALKAAQETIASLQAGKQEDEKEKIKAEVTAHAARGAIKPDAIDGWTNMICSAEGANREMLINSLKSLADNPLLGKQFGSKETEGSAAMDVEAEIMKKANELVAASQKTDERLNIFEARKRVLASDPELAARSVQSLQASAPSLDLFSTTTTWNGASLPGVNREAAKN